MPLFKICSDGNKVISLKCHRLKLLWKRFEYFSRARLQGDSLLYVIKCKIGAIWIEFVLNAVYFKNLLLKILNYEFNSLSGKELWYLSFWMRLLNIKLIIFYLNIRYDDVLIKRGWIISVLELLFIFYRFHYLGKVH